MDERLPRCRNDTRRCRSPGASFDDFRVERRELSTSGRRRAYPTQAEERQRQLGRQRERTGLATAESPQPLASVLRHVTKYRGEFSSKAMHKDALPSARTQTKGRASATARATREAGALD